MRLSLYAGIAAAYLGALGCVSVSRFEKMQSRVSVLENQVAEYKTRVELLEIENKAEEISEQTAIERKINLVTNELLQGIEEDKKDLDTIIKAMKEAVEKK